MESKDAFIEQLEQDTIEQAMDYYDEYGWCACVAPNGEMKMKNQRKKMLEVIYAALREETRTRCKPPLSDSEVIERAPWVLLHRPFRVPRNAEGKTA